MTLIFQRMETICVASRGRQTADGNKQHLEICPTAGKTNCLTTVAKDNLIMQRPRGNNRGAYYTDKTPTLTANAWQENNLVMKTPTKQLNPNSGRIRRLTPTECARLQTVPDWYKWVCSNTQQYKMLGNGWTIEVIKHILSFLPAKPPYPNRIAEPRERPKCGNCALCLHTYLGCECQLTDNPVEYEQDGCIDYIAEE